MNVSTPIPMHNRSSWTCISDKVTSRFQSYRWFTEWYGLPWKVSVERLISAGWRRNVPASWSGKQKYSHWKANPFWVRAHWRHWWVRGDGVAPCSPRGVPSVSRVVSAAAGTTGSPGPNTCVSSQEVCRWFLTSSLMKMAKGTEFRE